MSHDRGVDPGTGGGNPGVCGSPRPASDRPKQEQQHQQRKYHHAMRIDERLISSLRAGG